MKPKSIQKTLNPHVLPTTNVERGNYYEKDINWRKLWENLGKKHTLKIRFQMTSTHTIIYTECRLNRMGLSQVQGYCHFCKHHLDTQQHLFYNCKIYFL